MQRGICLTVINRGWEEQDEHEKLKKDFNETRGYFMISVTEEGNTIGDD